MHIADGIINGPTAAVCAALAAALLALCVVKARADLDDRLVPMAGLTAAFIFAVQMLNFPVLLGVSGHLLGGALAAALVGPWIGALCVAIVLIVQSLMFADGGITALGPNIVNMALIGAFVTYGVLRLLLRVLPRTTTGLSIAVFVTAVVSVAAGASGFVVEYAIGGTTNMPLPTVTGTMLGLHLLIGIVEGLITVTTVAAAVKLRPDLVCALKGHTPVPVPATVKGAA